VVIGWFAAIYKKCKKLVMQEKENKRNKIYTCSLLEGLWLACGIGCITDSLPGCSAAETVPHWLPSE
jgi:hypothetical protein